MTREEKQRPMRLAIAIPTYNEAKNVPKLASRIKTATKKAGVPCTLLIIDDNSPDGTGAVAEKLAKSERTNAFKVTVLHREAKDGFGRAYVAGFKQLLKGDYTHIMQMDADLSHDPKYLPQFIKAAADFNLVVGSRYIKGGATPDWSWNRKLLSRFGNLYTRIFLGSKIHDYTGGYNLYSATLLKALDINTLQAGGYGFLIELKYRALKKAKTVYEVPIIFMDRIHGTSKIPRSTIFKNLVLVPKLRFNNSKVAK